MKRDLGRPPRRMSIKRSARVGLGLCLLALPACGVLVEELLAGALERREGCEAPQRKEIPGHVWSWKPPRDRE